MAEKRAEALYLLGCIVNRGKRRRVRRILAEHGIRLSFNEMGMGTARSDLLTLFGIGEIERDFVFAGVAASAKRTVLEALKTGLKLERPGGGILFTIPMTSVGGPKTLELLAGSVPGMNREDKGETMQPRTAELIITIVQRGYAHDVVEAARSGGAQGATVLHGRAASEGEPRRFYGIMVEPQKDIVLLLVRRDVKADVMRKISAAAGLRTAGTGISFSLPVTDVVGALGFEDAPYVQD